MLLSSMKANLTDLLFAPLMVRTIQLRISWLAMYIQSCKMSIFYTDHFCSTKFTPKKKRVNCNKFLTFRILNGHKKQFLGQKYQKLYLEGCLEEKCHCSCAQKTTCFVFPQTFYPNVLIFLHRYRVSQKNVT